MSKKNQFSHFFEKANAIVLGKERVIRLSLTCILARGHILFEDVPGVGKTTLGHLLARLMNLPFGRIQMTSDLLPADIIGNLVFNRNKNTFEVYKGPIFSNLLLADELNRATPKTQSAFLQAMEEFQVSIDREIFDLPTPFIVFATQNPKQAGTFPIPESQLDRFLMRISIGHPSREFEKELLKGVKRKELISQVGPVFHQEDILRFQNEVQQVFTSDSVINYVLDILEKCRTLANNPPDKSLVILGPSPRGGLALIDASKAWAYIHGRDHVIPEDIQDILYEVFSHRMFPGHAGHVAARKAIEGVIESLVVY